MYSCNERDGGLAGKHAPRNLSNSTFAYDAPVKYRPRLTVRADVVFGKRNQTRPVRIHARAIGSSSVISL